MGLFRTDPKDHSDERLMELVVRGDERAFAVLYDRYQRKLLAYFHRMLWQDRERAQDFLQDLFTKIAQRPQQFDGSRPFRTWLYSVANNMCKNEYRRMATRKAALPELHATAAHVEEATAGAALDHRRFATQLQAELDKLDPDQKATFIMRHQEERSIKEIAAAFGISEGTVKSRLFYTLKKLAAGLPEFDPRPAQTTPATGAR
jgi:RNA polymerase sigma-70 factor (ECF subfamily)